MRLQLRPSLPDLLFIAVLLWLFAAGAGWSVLLADGDTGWHIRNGQQILSCWCVPHRDAFAFGSEAHPWFSWEWLSDALFAWLYGAAGLKGVVAFSGFVIAAASATLFRHMLWRGSDPFLSLALVLLAIGASSIHFLARPHVVTLLFLAVSAWALDRDRLRPWPGIWTLPVLIALWTNLHGGFLAAFPLLIARVIESVCERSRSTPRIRRDLALTGVCALATLLNPYGWRLHQHLFEFVRSDWIRRFVEEFQSPRFRSESMWQFELLLIAGIAILPSLLVRRRVAECFLILFWAHQALGSVRHVTVYCFMVTPWIATQLDAIWTDWAELSSQSAIIGIVRQISADWTRAAAGFSAAPAVVCAVLLLLPGAGRWPSDFPANKFPAAIVNRNWDVMSAPAAEPVRVFSTDQWSGYLIYRLNPLIRVFFDGRSDFFGPWRGDDYTGLMQGRPGSQAILERERVGLGLVPAAWPLAGLLAANPLWEELDADSQAILFRRKTPANLRPESAD
jgi:hypothetical protein